MDVAGQVEVEWEGEREADAATWSSLYRPGGGG
jgi:hypothetical protein